MFFSINDVLQVINNVPILIENDNIYRYSAKAWDSLSENVFTTKSGSSSLSNRIKNGADSTVDHSYITPTIIGDDTFH